MTPDPARRARRARRTLPLLAAGSLAAVALLGLAVLGGALAAAQSPEPGSPEPASPAATVGPAASPATASAAPGASAEGSSAPAGSSGPGPSGGAAISIIEKTFQPANVTIHVGDTVTWTVTQAIADSHSVTSGTYKDPSTWTTFDSGIKLHNDGDHFSFTFTAPGTYSYFCQVHPDTMSGIVTVEDVNGSTGGGTEGATPVESKLIAGVVLLGALVVLFGWAALYRRMNPAP